MLCPYKGAGAQRRAQQSERRTAPFGKLRAGRNGCATKDESDGRQSEERFLDCAGRRVRKSERGRKSRPAPLGMTVRVGGNKRGATSRRSQPRSRSAWSIRTREGRGKSGAFFRARLPRDQSVSGLAGKRAPRRGQKRRRAAAVQSKDGDVKSPLQTDWLSRKNKEKADPSLRSG